MTEPANFIVTIGRAIDKFLTAIGTTVQICIVLAILFAVGLYVLPVVEGLVYAGALLWLAGGLIVVVLFLLYEGWKRL
jgi:hypothetical protein